MRLGGSFVPGSSERWVCGYLIEFADGSEPEAKVVHIGTRDECEKLADSLPPVSYLGVLPVKQATLVIGPVGS
jgi:hypothetical protein